jgi:hypothetical protein
MRLKSSLAFRNCSGKMTQHLIYLALMDLRTSIYCLNLLLCNPYLSLMTISILTRRLRESKVLLRTLILSEITKTNQLHVLKRNAVSLNKFLLLIKLTRELVAFCLTLEPIVKLL